MNRFLREKYLVEHMLSYLPNTFTYNFIVLSKKTYQYRFYLFKKMGYSDVLDFIKNTQNYSLNQIKNISKIVTKFEKCYYKQKHIFKILQPKCDDKYFNIFEERFTPLIRTIKFKNKYPSFYTTILFKNGTKLKTKMSDRHWNQFMTIYYYDSHHYTIKKHKGYNNKYQFIDKLLIHLGMNFSVFNHIYLSIYLMQLNYNVCKVSHYEQYLIDYGYVKYDDGFFINKNIEHDRYKKDIFPNNLKKGYRLI